MSNSLFFCMVVLSMALLFQGLRAIAGLIGMAWDTIDQRKRVCLVHDNYTFHRGLESYWKKGEQGHFASHHGKRKCIMCGHVSIGEFRCVRGDDWKFQL